MHELPSLDRFFAQTWQHLKRSAGETIKHRDKFTRNSSACQCKYSALSTDNAVLKYYSFQRRRVGTVLTLDPKKFVEKKQRCFYIGGLQSFKPYIALHNQSCPVVCPRRLLYDSADKLNGREWSFPPDTKAFLYYFTPPDKPRIAGELRVRVVPSDDPSSFESGSDLLRVNGQTWSRPLHVLSKYYIPLYEKLREENLIPDDLYAALSAFPPRLPTGRYYTGQNLYTINDTFIIDLSIRGLSLSVITEQGMEALELYGLFTEWRVSLLPYTGEYTNHLLSIGDSNESVGSALARFERSTLREHKGTRTIVLRFLKVITSVIPLYDNSIVPPKEGELHRRHLRGALNSSVWYVNIDDIGCIKVRGLRLLWDT